MGSDICTDWMRRGSWPCKYLTGEQSRLRQEPLQRGKGGRVLAELEDQQGAQCSGGPISVEAGERWGAGDEVWETDAHAPKACRSL